MRQAVILVGGRGTRLGQAAIDTPKPLVHVAGERRFLDYLLENVARHGIEQILLLAGHLGVVVRDRYQSQRVKSADIEVIIEPDPAGTGGALQHAAGVLDDTFLMLNGDCWFDINYLALAGALRTGDVGALGVRSVEDAARYGQVELSGDRIQRFREKGETGAGGGLVSGGVYVLRRSVLDWIDESPCSIEVDVFPALAAQGLLAGAEFKGDFLDIGLPETLKEARSTFPERARRDGAFFDRDGTLIHDAGYTYRPEDLKWRAGAIEAIRRCNDAGRLVIVVTNQAGVARGFYREEDIERFHAAMQNDLRPHGAHIDAFYACPFHGEGVIEAYTLANHPDRKPNPGMLRRAMLDWSIDAERSFLIGDAQSDWDAATASGVKPVSTAAGDINELVALELRQPLGKSASSIDADLTTRAKRAREWLFDFALPLWWEIGFDQNALCFHEGLSQDGAPDAESLRRIRVQARQTAVFAQAGMMGWDGPWRQAVTCGARVLTEHGIRSDGGTRFRLNASGKPCDDRRDLYDTAFVLFGLGEASRALGDRDDLVATALQLSDWLERKWGTKGGGFLEGEITPTPPRRQNPHMHVLEAYLSLFRASGEAVFLDRANAIACLFRDKFFDQRFGGLPEYFDAAWRPVPDEHGAIGAEPGHEFEWCWLLYRLHALGGLDLRYQAERLRIHAETYGLNSATSTVVEEIHLDGRARKLSSRLWPHTERLKANLAHFEATRDPISARNACQAFDVLLRDHLSTPVKGLWIERRTDTGAAIEADAPASSLYHISLAFHELLRVSSE